MRVAALIHRGIRGRTRNSGIGLGGRRSLLRGLLLHRGLLLRRSGRHCGVFLSRSVSELLKGNLWLETGRVTWMGGASGRQHGLLVVLLVTTEPRRGRREYLPVLLRMRGVEVMMLSPVVGGERRSVRRHHTVCGMHDLFMGNGVIRFFLRLSKIANISAGVLLSPTSIWSRLRRRYVIASSV